MKKLLLVFLTAVSLVVFSLASILADTEPARDSAKERGGMLLKAIAEEQPGAQWDGAEIIAIRQVAQSPRQLYSTRLKPVWYAEVATKTNEKGYLAWDVATPGRLVEFALDTSDQPANSQCLAGVPNLQQFPVPGKSAPQVASGCVPTAGADLIGYWISKRFPQWSDTEKPSEEALKAITLRLRDRIPMEEYPDKAGYTENQMPLSGAMPEGLAKAIREDAAAHGVKVTVALEKFAMEVLKREVEAKRPVLLTCTVRLPHKPELSWGHEMAGIGWTRIDGEDFVGVCDNFFPVKNPGTIRWIRADAFQSILTVVPKL